MNSRTDLGELSALLAHYPTACQPRQIHALGANGGYSGAQFWQLQTAAGPYCLRCWPAAATRVRLDWIHAVLAHAWEAGIGEIPLPVANLRGQTITRWAGNNWELAPWMPGGATYHSAPGEPKLRSAVELLARFHRATARYEFDLENATAAAPGIAQRLQRLRQFQAYDPHKLAEAAARVDWPGWLPRAERLRKLFSRVAARIESELLHASAVRVPLQPCLRDVWHDHILFCGDRATGLVDFGAMRVETVAGDLARLLGSLVDDDSGGWQRGLAAYQRIRPLQASERSLIGVYDRSAVALSGMNWLWWLAIEGRRFDGPDAILQRLDRNMARLEKLAGGESAWPS